MKVDKRVTGYYGVTLSDREAKTGSYMYNKIIDILAEKSVEIRPDTYMQKTAVEVVRALKLDFVTRGVLHFGEIIALPPANAIPNVTFNDTELPSFIDENDFNLLVKEKCNVFDYMENKESISAAQHVMHDNRLYINFDKFMSAIEENLSVEEIFPIIDEINEQFKEFPDISFTKKMTEKHLYAFTEIAKELLWKKNRYIVTRDIQYTFDTLQKMIGNCRFYDTVQGDSKEEYKEVTKKEHPALEAEFKRNLENLVFKLKTYTRIDQRKSELAFT
ncbi:MAG: hypothetical protein DRP85_09665 [Candidatus Makaraimicrobium thalassicum]|nr:MAG: hypothetical protein DRP85_09665 [Candidatus Omnitrophota bacterium]